MPTDERSPDLSDMLERYVQSISADRVTFGEITAALGQRSMPTLLLVFALPMALPVPAPGISVIFGIPMIVIAAQLAIARSRAWLPNRLANHSILRSDLARYIERMDPALRRLERLVRPRAEWIIGRFSSALVGLVCLVLAVVITLPVPFGHFVPGTAISLLSLGLIERDGLVIGVGLVVAVAALVIASLASAGLISAFWL